MIQPAAPSITSSLALNPGNQAAQGDGAAVSGDFAALLRASVPNGDDKPGDAAASPEQAMGRQLRQQPGKGSGKELPLDLPEIEPASADQADVDQTPAKTAGYAAEALAIKGLFPGLALTLRMSQANPTATGKSPYAAINAAEATISRTPRAPTVTEKTPAEAQTGDEEPDAALAIATLTTAAVPVTIPIIQTAPVEPAGAPEPTLPTNSTRSTHTPEVVAIAIRPAAPLPAEAAAPAETAPAAAGIAKPQPEPTTSEPAAPKLEVPFRSAESAATAPAPRRADAPAAPQVQMMAAQQSPPSTAAPAKLVAAPQPDAEAPAPAGRDQDEAPRATVAAAPSAARRDPSAGEADRSADRPASPEPFAALPRFAATAPQAMPMASEAQTLTRSVDPTAAPAAASVRQADHDFTAIVDRLVEAREAAVPRAVQATISHSEFGQVSLRFDQDAAGLSVAMSSADPDFARAVQASAASAQSQTASDNGSNAPRQESPAQQQQNTGSASGQSQPQSSAQASAQANSQSSGRNDRSAAAQTENRSGNQPGDQAQDDESAETRSGIYA